LIASIENQMKRTREDTSYALASLFQGEALDNEIYRGFVNCHSQFKTSPALIDHAGTWSYDDVFRASTRLARHLARRGVEGNDLVVVIGDRCATFVVYLIGILMAGARFVVLDRKHMAKESVAAVARLKPKHWLSIDDEHQADDELDRFLSSLDGECSRYSRIKQRLFESLSLIAEPRSLAEERIPRSLDADARAYAIWTSGTTREPRLVSTLHRSVVNFIDWYKKEFSLDRADRISMLSGLAHDPILRDIFAPLSVGASLHIPSESVRLDSVSLANWIAESKVTVMHMTPSLLDRLVKPHGDKALESPRLLAFGGQQLTGRHIAKSRLLFPRAEIVNLYGATETPQAMGFYRVELTRQSAGDVVPIGKGIRGTELLVLGVDGRRCKTDEHGEIYVRSRFLAEGYIDQPEATQARFVANPLTREPGDRVFRTGDVGFFNDEGAVRLVGRSDRQIKVSGHRVDLDDIEAELTNVASVAEAAIVFDTSKQQIVAYVVEAAGARVSEDELREHVSAHISVYAIPAKIIVIAALPITPNGKLDYASLPTVAHPAAEEAAERSFATTTGMRAELMSIWAGALNVDPVRGSDSFYELGGDSILAHKIVGDIHTRLAVSIRAADLFIYPTFDAFEQFLLERAPAPTADEGEAEKQRANRQRAIEAARNRQGSRYG
jgi:amino acid adenylation domain-containing protein